MSYSEYCCNTLLQQGELTSCYIVINVGCFYFPVSHTIKLLVSVIVLSIVRKTYNVVLNVFRSNGRVLWHRKKRSATSVLKVGNRPTAAPHKWERRNLTSDDIHRILAELGREEAEGKSHEESLEDDVSDDPEQEGIEDDIHQSESEIDLENGGGNDTYQQELPTNYIRFYIGKDMETIWASSANITSTKSKSKNIVITLPGPTGQARQCETRLESFQCIITPEMVEGIVRYTNIYIERKNLACQALAEGSGNSEVRERDYKPTTTTEMLALFGAL
ncbi:uncharacterized protein LOC126335675 [Schistocerca gregaria]|uniref:uncharacterized protein LOC126335675 n=1 Tax=Schistocerca gregaria TaxID=7010 RepID=UPI00211E227F|nr:uncharacterized protein LOC126335675 [Schistocerca gregaria]